MPGLLNGFEGIKTAGQMGVSAQKEIKSLIQ